jgi:hypothetical protein
MATTFSAAEFRRKTRNDKGRKRGRQKNPRKRDVLLGTTTSGKVVRGVAATAVAGTVGAALLSKTKGVRVSPPSKITTATPAGGTAPAGKTVGNVTSQRRLLPEASAGRPDRRPSPYRQVQQQKEIKQLPSRRGTTGPNSSYRRPPRPPDYGPTRPLNLDVTPQKSRKIAGRFGATTGAAARTTKNIEASRRTVVKTGAAMGPAFAIKRAQEQIKQKLSFIGKLSKAGATASDIADANLNKQLSRRQFLQRAAMRGAMRNRDAAIKGATAPVRAVGKINNAMQTGAYQGRAYKALRRGKRIYQVRRGRFQDGYSAPQFLGDFNKPTGGNHATQTIHTASYQAPRRSTYHNIGMGRTTEKVQRETP